MFGTPSSPRPGRDASLRGRLGVCALRRPRKSVRERHGDLGAAEPARGPGLWARRFRKGESGTTVLELALVSPFLILLFAAVIQFGLIFYVYAAMESTARTVARDLSLAAQNSIGSVSAPTLDTSANPPSFTAGYDSCTNHSADANYSSSAEKLACDDLSRFTGISFEVVTYRDPASVSAVGIKVPISSVFILNPFGLLNTSSTLEADAIMPSQ